MSFWIPCQLMNELPASIFTQQHAMTHASLHFFRSVPPPPGRIKLHPRPKKT